MVSDRKAHCFQQYSLAVGAKASVVAFLRCATLLQWIALKLDVIVSCYFDDYVCLSPPCLASNSDKCFASTLDLLGWEYDQTGDKADAMSECVQVRGVIAARPTVSSELPIPRRGGGRTSANRSKPS